MGEHPDGGEELIFRSPTLKLPLLRIPAGYAASMHSPEHPSGTATPPLQTLASVPFKWEEEPGKPRPCSDIIIHPSAQPAATKSLELPPCRVQRQLFGDKITQTPSPTAVLDGPYNVGRPKFSSFRFFREAQDLFDGSSSSCSSAASPHPGSSVDVLLLDGKSSSSILGVLKPKGFFGKLKRGKKEVNHEGGSFRFSSPSTVTSWEFDDSDENCTKGNSRGGNMKRNGSFCNVSHARPAHLFATIYEGLKQVMPWKSSRKSKKEAPL